MASTSQFPLAIVLLLTCPPLVDANLSSLCCGDNFCCAILATTNKATCWGGNSMSSKVPKTSTVKALTCGGKSVMGIDSNMQVRFYVGSDGYGPDHASASTLIGVAIRDADLSFWGGAILKTDGTVLVWGPSTVYCKNANSITCQPTSTQPTEVNFAFTNVPTGPTSFTGLNCGGKRGGHWCCAYKTGAPGLTCFGDNRGKYTPTSAEVSKIDFMVYQISAGVNYVAVLGSSGQLGVYGSGSEIGAGLSNKNPTSIADLNMGSVLAREVYVQVSTMNFAVYALKADGAIHAWGKRYSYTVGGGGSVDMAASVPSGLKFGHLSSGNAGVYAHYCALKSDGTASCWGADYNGQVTGFPKSVVSTAYLMPSLLTASGASSSNRSAGTSTGTSSLNLPQIKPNVFLSDPIDAFAQPGLNDHHGYCIDIYGKPGSNTCDNKAVEARSCRIAGEDTQFEYDSASSAIKATNYNTYCSGGSGPCLEVSGNIAVGALVILKACDASAAQTFGYRTADCQFTIGGLCLVVASKSVAMSGLKRPISLQSCSGTDAARREWTVVNSDTATITACTASSVGTSATSGIPATAATSATVTSGASSASLARGTKASMTHVVAIAMAVFVSSI